MSLTAAQQDAVAARGNVLVVAGAGAGKTSTLVERCLACLLSEQPRVSLDEILMVTFTEAAAAEMRQRIRSRLEEETRSHPEDSHCLEQLALFDTAHIGTLHSFCLELVRQHFYELELDPQLAVMPEEEARLLAEETLDGLMKKYYAGRGDFAETVRRQIQAQGKGWAKPIRALVLRLHKYSQTRPDPSAWLASQKAMFETGGPDIWLNWLLEGLVEWRDDWLPALQAAAGRNEVAGNCATALEALPRNPSRAQATLALDAIATAQTDCPRGKKGLWVSPFKKFFAEAAFLMTLARRGEAQSGAASASEEDPLTEDWNWVREQMTTLLDLAKEFAANFTEAKRELGMVDYHDLEQYALRLLWDSTANQPAKIARQWRRKLRFVFVDEYQDINAAQDCIIRALSREAGEANRFLVGDVKQSIYRFRLAEPRIFQEYVRGWKGEAGQCIPLADNFRSREGILVFVNELFGMIMREDIGGVAYDEQARLQFGAAEERHALSSAADPAPRVELRLRIKGANHGEGDDEAPGEDLDAIRDLEEADKEARLVALRLRELKAQQHLVWDAEGNGFRPVNWSDMAVLLRAPSRKAESYAKEFSRLNIPLQVSRSGFYESLEISDLLNLLRVLDNPLQDLPVLAVLHSPLIGLSLSELAEIRLAAKDARFWTTLNRWAGAESARKGAPGREQQVRGKSQKAGQPHDAGASAAPNGPDAPQETCRKVTGFLDRFARWRRMARQVSLSQCLENILSETHYAQWLLTQPRGEQRRANVQRLLALAQQFDHFQRQGLFRFLRFIEAQEAAGAEPDVPAVMEEDAIQLMSIHQSKGLEFPVVVVADLGKLFNQSDLKAEIILDEKYGLCPKVKPPELGATYPSLPYWLAQRRQLRELLGEELRLLYVAMTRARDTLILSGTIPQSRFAKLWKGRSEPGVQIAQLLEARSCADWLGLWFSRHCIAGDSEATEGRSAWLDWKVQDDAALAGNGPGVIPEESPDEPILTAGPEAWGRLKERLAWKYGFEAATREPAKASVSSLRRRVAAAGDEEAFEIFGREARRRAQDPAAGALVPSVDSATSEGAGSGGLSATELGNAHHAFLQSVALDCVGDIEGLRDEALRLESEGILRSEEAAALDFEGLAAFWNSALGLRVRKQAKFVRRELAFTARFETKELARLAGIREEAGLENEFSVVQGVADLAVVLATEIWLVDFKTDRVTADALQARARTYEPQVKIYARALSRIYRRPVSECWLFFLSLRKAFAVSPD